MRRKSWVVLCSVVALVLAPGLLSPVGAADPGAPENVTPPAVTGTPQVGVPLTASRGTWVPEPTTYSYRWLRDGVQIPGAYAASYTPVPADRTHHLAVQVTTAAGEAASDAAVSAPTAAVAYGRLALLAKPAVTGTRRWGKTVTASPGTWSPMASAYRYQWLADDKPIAGATSRRYTIGVAQFGKHLSVRVTARRDGYANAVAASSRTGAIDHRVPVKKKFTYSIATRGAISADLTQFAALAAQTYADPRGWRAAGYQFTRVAKGGDFTLVLANARTMPSFGYPCSTMWSCRVGRNVVINQSRWLHASPAWNAAHLSLRNYRHMVVDHETGHWLGHHHRSCPGKGQLAPVMMQQSKGLDGCRFNPFPLASERWTSR